MRSVALREQHLMTLVFRPPAIVIGASVNQMRGQQGKHAQSRFAEVFETDLLQDRVAAWVGDDPLQYSEAASTMGARHQERWNAVLQRFDNDGAIAFLLGKEAASISNDQTEIAGASLVDLRVVDFVEDPMAEGEPDAAVRRQRGANSALGA